MYFFREFIARWATRPSRNLTPFELDFTKPWWHIFASQKTRILIIFFTTALFEVMDTLFPLIIGWALKTQNFGYLVLVILPYLVEEVSSWFTVRPLLTKLYTQTMESFRLSAYKYLLALDPVFHTRQSSGVSIGKIRRTTEAFYTLTKKLVDDLVPLCFVLITSMASVFFINTILGIATTFAFALIVTVSGLLATVSTRRIEAAANRDDDRANHLGTETLTRLQFIRASFASDQIRQQLEESHTAVMKSTASLFMAHRILRGLTSFFYLCCTGALAGLLIALMRTKSLDPVTALSILIMILRSTAPLLKLDKYLTEAVSAYRKITDFYLYLQGYGKQTFPVYVYQNSTPLQQQTCQTDPISIAVSEATVSYEKAIPFFNKLSLFLDVPRNAPSKLYGIIGPSGIGKTTFLSLVGGQLKPTNGHVFVNGCDIYELNDVQRQRLIALQGQVAASLYGSLRENLTFGLPLGTTIPDEKLIQLLESVGLWYLFKEKKGLETAVGEGGFTLSGGQRQRLNFANLFLRAQTYHPSLILIDEPTSSLDEISEQRITEMITQLAETSLTLVIAHRLKTVEHAEKILDFCLVNQSNQLMFYTREELEERSLYYKQLLEGNLLIEE